MPPETPQTTSAVLYWVLGGAFVIICSLIAAIYAANNSRIKKVEDDMKTELSEQKKDFEKQFTALINEVKGSYQKSANIEHNYIKRFEEVNNSINQLNTTFTNGFSTLSEKLLKAITSIQIDLAKNYVAKEECEKC